MGKLLAFRTFIASPLRGFDIKKKTYPNVVARICLAFVKSKVTFSLSVIYLTLRRPVPVRFY